MSDFKNKIKTVFLLFQFQEFCAKTVRRHEEEGKKDKAWKKWRTNFSSKIWRRKFFMENFLRINPFSITALGCNLLCLDLRAKMLRGHKQQLRPPSSTEIHVRTSSYLNFKINFQRWDSLSFTATVFLFNHNLKIASQSRRQQSFNLGEFDPDIHI